MSVAAGACGGLGYVIDREEGLAAVEAFAQRAELAGVGDARASEMFRAAVDQEGDAWDRMASGAEDAVGAGADELVTGADFIVDRCRSASANYPAVLAADGDEPATGREFMDRLLAGQ